MPDTLVANETEKALLDWFRQMEEYIHAVDFEPAKALYTEDVVGFGTFEFIAEGIKDLSTKQWGNIWPKIKDFQYLTDSMYWDASGDVAWAACKWTSTGFDANGNSYTRPGRVTVTFKKVDGKWLSVHTHYSLSPR